MKKCTILSIAILAIFLSAGLAFSDTITLGIVPSAQTVLVGSSASVDINIVGLGDMVPDSLGAFDLDLIFDPAILAFNNATFGDPVLGDQLDLFGFGSIVDVIFGSGTVNLFELSLDLPSDLETMQAGAFTLATVEFDAIGLGTSPLNVSVNALGDAWGDPLVSAIVDGNISSVPEPSSIILFGTGFGIVILFIWRRKRLL